MKKECKTCEWLRFDSVTKNLYCTEPLRIFKYGYDYLGGGLKLCLKWKNNKFKLNFKLKKIKNTD